MREGDVFCLSAQGFHRMHYVEWGDPRAERVAICVHGMTRSGRDFDELARALPELRVVCPDVVGRGSSDWLQAKEGYNYGQYCTDMTALIARVTGAGGRVYWVGNSMGGIIGMLLAAVPRTPIEKLVLVDVGAILPKEAVERVVAYIDKDPRFQSLRELEAYVRLIYASFGPLTDAQWQHLAEHSARRHTDGRWGMRHDPGIAIPLKKGPLAAVDLWQYYDAIRCPTLLLRGAQSDLLRTDTAQEMTRRGPRARLVEFQGIGHAPALTAADQIAVVRDFLLKD